MKNLFTVLAVILISSTVSCSPDEETLTTTTEPIFPIYLDLNGITIKAYDFALVGNEYEVNVVTVNFVDEGLDSGSIIGFIKLKVSTNEKENELENFPINKNLKKPKMSIKTLIMIVK